MPQQDWPKAWLGMLIVLKQTDFDGQFSYSDIERVVFTASDAIWVFPNPAQNEVTINSEKLLDPSKLRVSNKCW
jgi:hypothetical protein